MDRESSTANGEVHLPAGVVAQEFCVMDKRLRLRHRYPLGMFLRTGTLDAYKGLVHEIDAFLESDAGEKDILNETSIAAFDRKLLRRRYVERANGCLNEIFSIVLDHLAKFDEKINIFVCQRMRIDPLTHQPLIDRWMEFVDLELAPTAYSSLWYIAKTIFMPAANCIRTSELLGVTLPPINVLKLLPRSLNDSGIPDTCPPRLAGLLELKKATIAYTELETDLHFCPFSKGTLWDGAWVMNLIQKFQPIFQNYGVGIHYCQMFSLATIPRVFQWIEFVDSSLFPDYVPQYEFVIKNNESASTQLVTLNHVTYKVKRDKLTQEAYLKTIPLRQIRARAFFYQKEEFNCFRNIYRRPAPHIYWYEDTV